MERLIDADKFKGKVIASHTGSGVIKLIAIDEVPTAYDPDKVAERLKALTEEECTLHECGLRSEHCKACIAKKAIEIVKGGGVDERS